MNIGWKHAIASVVAVPIVGLFVGWTGLIGIGASGGHWAVTDWFLHWVMRNSVETAALSMEAPPLDDPALLPLAAGHYETACAVCHGSPAQPRSDAVLAMLPPPPDLQAVVPSWTDEQLFQIVQHGVRYTGMPAWPTQVRPDEAWAMAAFLRKLPDMDAAKYYDVSGLHQPPMEGEVSPMPITCESCHGERKLNSGSLIPSLAGQSEAYLLESLRAYAGGRRASGVMGVAVGTLPQEALPDLARYYAGQSRPERPVQSIDAALIERGRELAERGRPQDKIPACLSCHEKPGANPVYPKLSGQAQPYLERQLTLFKDGVRGGTRYHHLMTEAAKYLEEDDIAAASAYFATKAK
ncbi:c-type cytochrome [Neorhizobium sp. T786]|uniref:c-type cytochrome n=1 Tax=Pseudorhizobium xiangyangii TaxID=2883104 RepID=UPI001CFF5785|nr:c-type cytochrome [Neorhizobium xiangyangii]MCB5203642.1 c-type cytochrome [Neorhizobium xiangyangii]